MVFVERKSKTIHLVELKLGRLERSHGEQLQRYLDHARESKLLRGYLDEGWSLAGVLASPDAGKFKARSRDIVVKAVDARKVIRILKKLRRKT